MILPNFNIIPNLCVILVLRIFLCIKRFYELDINTTCLFRKWDNLPMLFVFFVHFVASLAGNCIMCIFNSWWSLYQQLVVLVPTVGGPCTNSWWSLYQQLVVLVPKVGGPCTNSWWSLYQKLVVLVPTVGGPCTNSWWSLYQKNFSK